MKHDDYSEGWSDHNDEPSSAERFYECSSAICSCLAVAAFVVFLVEWLSR